MSAVKPDYAHGLDLPSAIAWVRENAERLRSFGPWWVEPHGGIRCRVGEAECCPLSVPEDIQDHRPLAEKNGIGEETAQLLVHAADATGGHWRDIRQALLEALIPAVAPKTYRI